MRDPICYGGGVVVRSLSVGLILAMATAGGIGHAADRKEVSRAAAATEPAAQNAGTTATAIVSAVSAKDSAGAAGGNFASLPLSFEVNRGQSAAQVQYLSRGSGYTLFLTADEAVLKLPRLASSANISGRFSAVESSFAGQHAGAGLGNPGLGNNHHRDNSPSVLRMRLMGANPAAEVMGLEELPGKSNYFIGNDPSKWRTNVANYAKVKYQGTYPGVDLVYYGNQSQLEYDFVVAPGADPGIINMEIAADFVAAPKEKEAPMKIDANGDLVISLVGRQVRFHQPLVYQPTELAGAGGQGSASAGKSLIGARWIIKNRNRVGFELAAYDRRKPLVIDPALSFSTFLGGSLADNTYSIAVDASSNVYVTGTTDSTDFPTEDPYQANNAGSDDAFITKFNATGTALIYSTYLGGSATDFAFGLALDSANDVYVVGTTGSTNFPVTATAYQTTCVSCPSNFPSAFVTELNSSGSALVYSTYVGGSNDARGYAIAVDSSNNAYITGRTSCTDFPTTSGALQKTLNGVQNVFVTKLNSAGTALVYSTYVGGSGSDQANGIAIDSSNNAFVAGSSSSTNYPTTTGAYQTTLRGIGNAIISKVNSTGTALVYSTYLGGNASDIAWGIRVDSSKAAYVVGQTSSTNFPTSATAFQTTCSADCAANDAFVSKLNPAGTALSYSTYLGGGGEQEAFALALDSTNDAYVTGRTNSPNFPLTKGTFQSAFGGVYDAFVTELNPTGSNALYSTYLGGSASDAGLGITVDAAKNIYVTGRTYSTTFPVTPTAYAPTCTTCGSTGYEDGFVTKFNTGDQVWPLTLNFGSQQVGVKSSALTAVLSNSGTSALTITGVSAGGNNQSEFGASDNCGSSLAVGASCTISVTFTPSATGPQTATLNIADSASNSPQTISLSGAGTNNTVSLTPTSMTFATQLVGTVSPAQNAVLTNTGSGTVTLTNIATSGEFNQSNNCGATLGAGASCSIGVVFQPTTQGADKGALKVTDNAGGSPQTVALTAAATVVTLTPSALNFGNQKAGTTSAAQSITVTNTGAGTLTIKKIAVTGTNAADFAESTTCGTSLAAGTNCTVSVTFTPKTTGTFAAALSVADTGGATPQSATLAGTGD